LKLIGADQTTWGSELGNVAFATWSLATWT